MENKIPCVVCGGLGYMDVSGRTQTQQKQEARRKAAKALRDADYTYAQIAKTMGYKSRSSISNLLND